MDRRTSLTNKGLNCIKNNSLEGEDIETSLNNSGNYSIIKSNNLSTENIEDGSYLEGYTSVVSTRMKRLEKIFENLTNRKESLKNEINVLKTNITKVAEKMHSKIDQDCSDLLEKTDTYYKNEEQKLDKLQSQLMESMKAAEEFNNFVQQVKQSCSVEEQNEQQSEIKSRQQQLDSVKHDVAFGSIKFFSNNDVLGNIIGKVKINDTDTSDPYADQPKEIGLIEGNQMVAGVTMLNERIYIIRELLPNVEVYMAADLSRYKMLKLEGLRKPSDITGDVISGHVYISDAVGSIYKLQPDENVLTKLPVDVSGEPQGIFVLPAEAANAGNLLVTCYDSRQLKEFTPAGQLVKSIRFQQDVLSPWHVVPSLRAGWLGGGDGLVVKKYALCHGWEGGKQHRVCLIDDSGRNLKTHGASNGSGAAKLDVPSRMAVDPYGYIFVADRNNDRIVLLSPNLVYVRDIISRSYGARQPRRVHLDSLNGKLYVGLVDGSVRIFQLSDYQNGT
ncbi:hypothetical protein HELRODRAFT_191437 [Helobdella robusta]|uniref:SMP-30/Gluconolactonase/LRE-like region domain-containing protein n=1 Tax=Helobdella robusta TaxID=6412 RepID=T1FSZ5_HELRO|nr:hypothetical protein HELRODRAFT_191437 [Helobdella robusta]ESO05289.1 hypothetical protein HELRODRAFT_191437 [Helobdella robusta]